jgi:hypothetical protein
MSIDYLQILYSEKDARNFARLRGKDIRFPAENELFIDIDNTYWLQKYRTAVEIIKSDKFNQYLNIKIVDEVFTKSPGGGKDAYHVVVTLDKAVDGFERLLLQALMGSDPVRELLGLVELKAGNEKTTCFFEKREVTE